MTLTPDPTGQFGRVSRRSFVVNGVGIVAGAGIGGHLVTRRWWSPARADAIATPSASQAEALRVLGRSTLRMPDTLPVAGLPAGTDTIPEIEHVVVLQLENHSYDNFFGMLGRGFGQRPRGDGFTLAADGLPNATNPYADGRRQRAFRMPTTCQLPARPSQEWTASHTAYDEGRLDGFVRTVISPVTTDTVGPVAMGYWTADELPFTYDLASRFPIGDRFFCSVLSQTHPNRRFLIAGTAAGMTGDVGGNPVANAGLGVPAANGTIFNRLSAAGISWLDYAVTSTTGATMNLFPANDGAYEKTNIAPFDQFYADAKAGTLPAFSLLDPNFGTQSQENPQNITLGEELLAKVVNALGNSPKWRQTLLIVNWDEHGGYYDHVPPPVALAPDSIPPQVLPGEQTYDGFARFGFRVPAVVVGPYAKRDYVSHLVYDHTSILAFLERKWNLASMTLRDANANDLTDFIDLAALKLGQPTFPELPRLAPAGNNAARLACSKTGAGKIPAPLPPARVLIRSATISNRPPGLVIELQNDPGTLNGLEVSLHRGRTVLSHRKVNHVIATAPRRVFLPVKTAAGRRPGREHLNGSYTVVVKLGRRTMAQRSFTFH